MDGGLTVYEEQQLHPIKRLQAWLELHPHSWPTSNAKDKEEASLGRFVVRLRAARKGQGRNKIHGSTFRYLQINKLSDILLNLGFKE